MAKQKGNSGGNSGSNKGSSRQQGNNSPKPNANESFKGVGRPPKTKGKK